jgi:hypothetical protein
MKNNAYQTNEELADIAESIITGRPLQEDMVNELTTFINNYKSMKDILVNLQDYLKDYAQRGQEKSGLMGNGLFTKAFNASRKVDLQLNRMNDEAKEFVTLMKQIIK